MKYTLHIDTTREEEITVYAHKKSKLIERIEELIKNDDGCSPIIGYRGTEMTVLSIDEVYCFALEDKKLYAITSDGRYLVKKRLYEIEERMPSNFVKINQSAIANISAIERFGVSFGTSMTVYFKNGYRDYVSRRQIKQLKERLGL